MTQKSKSRRERDEKQRMANGGKRIDRERHSRCWFELKMTHSRSQEYISKTARLFQQYAVPQVLLRIEANGDGERWAELQKKVPELMGPIIARFQELYDSHKDRRKLCLSYAELQLAFRIFEAYQVFDLDFYNTMSPIIEELNDIFNKALGQEIEEGNIKKENATQPSSATSPEEQQNVEVDPAVGAGLISPQM